MLYIPYVTDADIDYASTYQDYISLLWINERKPVRTLQVRLDWQRYKGWHKSEYDPYYAQPATAGYVQANEDFCAELYRTIYGDKS